MAFANTIFLLKEYNPNIHIQTHFYVPYLIESNKEYMLQKFCVRSAGIYCYNIKKRYNLCSSNFRHAGNEYSYFKFKHFL